MKKYLLLFAIACSVMLMATSVFAGGGKPASDDLLRKSLMSDPGVYPDFSTFPRPFSELGGISQNPAISTGYYFVDSDDNAPDFWRPNPDVIDTLTEPNLWRRILSGPRLIDPTYWTQNPSEGLRFFRNPAYPASTYNFFTGPTDSTDDAIAGPMSIGFNFYFNGIRYDSFYVSTNGIVCLTNRRYFYDNTGARTLIDGSSYDPQSNDWFARSGSRVGNGMTDLTPDDYGYTYSVLGNSPTSANAGIRQRGGALNNGTFTAYRSAVIAPFFGDLHVSQYNKTTNAPDDYGKVYFKRANSGDRLWIYFLNMAPVRSLSTPNGTYTGNFDLRPGDANYVSGNAQVLLDSRDNSVTVTFETFFGLAMVNGKGIGAKEIFRYNTSCGVAGFARHVNFGRPGGPTYPWAAEYQQYTHYYGPDPNAPRVYPHSYLAVKFKQYQNTLRVVDMQYRVRKTDPNADLNFTEVVPSSKVNNYELLAGEERIGAIQPVAIIQNLTNNIQGPNGNNYVPQELNFRARFRIINEASQRIIYNRLVPIDSTCLATPDSATQNCTGDPYVKVRLSTVTVSSGNYTATPVAFPGTNLYHGIPPYGFVQVYFPPFEPNEFVNNHIGRLRTYIIADPTNPKTQESLGDSWPFDDTTSVSLFVMKRLPNFYDDVTSFHIVNRTAMPSTLKWVNIDAEVSDGDVVSNYPLPPRGSFSATNNFDFSFTDPDFTQSTYNSPVIRMNRLTLAQNEPNPASSPIASNGGNGDELRSFPIDITGRLNSVLSVSIQRTAKADDWPRGWGDATLVGCEPRSITDVDSYNPWSYYNSASNKWDEICVEFAKPTTDGINGITNLPEASWRYNLHHGGAKAETKMAAYTLFGAGGHMVGFLESNKDSAMAPWSAANLQGLRVNIYDDGIDYEYNKVFVTIPDTVINAPNNGAHSFRFRLKVYANNNQKCSNCIPDDEDAFFVDNVNILFPSEITDIEMTLVKPLWPYTIAPASQAIKIPIHVKFANNTSVDAPAFLVKVKIYKSGDYKPVYCRVDPLPGLRPGSILEYAMPNWNARQSGGGQYRLVANVFVPGGDLNPMNDTTYSDFTLNLGSTYAYDPAASPKNDVPNQSFTGLAGKGLSMAGFHEGGTGSYGGPWSGYDEVNWGSGYVGGSTSGQIAMKFQVFQADTIYGFQAYWGEMNQALDDIALAVYTDQSLPGYIVPGTLAYKQRGIDDTRGGQIFFGEYVTYTLAKPVVLAAGNYWAAVAQMGETGMELGASMARSGMRITKVDTKNPFGGAVGESGYHLALDKTFRKTNNSGNLINNNFFAYENTRGSNSWQQFMPTIGNPAYAHLHHFGTSPNDNTTATLTRGSWVPMLRPYFGTRSIGPKTYEICIDDSSQYWPWPVQMSLFDGMTRNNGINLYWQTASEINNSGFKVERKIGTSDANDWQDIAFVKGAGTSRSPLNYNYLDAQVTPNTTYQYRLRQVDADGSITCESSSKVITLVYTGSVELTLEPNAPNPFKDNTTIGFYMPFEQNVKLEILDIFGNVVNTLVDETLASSRHSYSWNGLDQSGSLAPSGTYLCRLTAGDQVKIVKMTLVR